MINSTLKYFFSIFIWLIFSSGLAFGQVGRYAPSALRIGADPGTLMYTVFSEKRGFFELESDVDIDKFFLVANYGLSSYDLNEDTYSYSNNGTYFRIGADINLMNKDPNLNIAFFGIRYAASRFNDKLNYNTKTMIHPDTGWPSTWEESSNDNVRARWFELVSGMKIRVVKQLYFGFTIRYKIFKNVSPVDELRPYYIPGFGKNIVSSNSAFGFNYYVSYRLPFRKKIIYTENDKVIEDKKSKK